MKNMKVRKALFAAVMVGFGQVSIAVSFDVTFTANDGIQVETPKEQLLVDAVYQHYTDWEGFSFDAMPEGLLAQLQQTTKPLSLLATHVHRDHFHPETIGQLMDGRTNVTAYGPVQVIESVKEGFINEHRISKQMNCVGKAPCKTDYVTAGGLKITGILLSHTHKTYAWIDNVAYIVADDQQSLLHVGDAMPSQRNFDKISAHGTGYDLAIVPYWYVMDEKLFDAFMATVKPKKLALIHLPKERLDQMLVHVKSLKHENIVVPAPGLKL